VAAVAVKIRTVDEQGRIVLPKAWREKYLAKAQVVMSTCGDTIRIKPLTVVDLTEYFDRLEVDVKADLSDWHKVRRELRTTQNHYTH
jgi:bifunctional DNA-binding transcriptional regulator/antitoxin component of YhaV-PrlF toxin-antitoxin module